MGKGNAISPYLRKTYRRIASEKKGKIALGVGDTPELQKKSHTVVKEAEKYGITGIVLVGRKIVGDIASSGCEVIESEEPEEYLIDLLKKREVSGAVRGSLSASKMLRVIKRQYRVNTILRMGPIDVSGGRTYFLGPLGIDEGLDISEKFTLVSCMKRVVEKLGMEPRVAVMSLGRKEDYGRNETVDRSLEDAEKLVCMVEEHGIVKDVYDIGIVMEKLDEIEANCILAPTGYIGNIMYRTLVHLGCGHSYGGYVCGLPDVFIDTSRGGHVEEYLTSIAMAKAAL